MTRDQLIAEAHRLRTRGLNGVQIAASLGVGCSTVYQWFDDPDGAKARARKESYRGICIDCGSQTDGSNGPSGAPRRCAQCRHRFEREDMETRRRHSLAKRHYRYAEDELLDYLRKADAVGASSTVRYDALAAARGWASSQTFVWRFGSWNAARQKAGLTLNRQGRSRWSCRWSDEDCRAALETLTRELGYYPSAKAYEAWSRGRDDVPSMATIRARFGTWMAGAEAVAA